MVENRTLKELVAPDLNQQMHNIPYFRCCYYFWIKVWTNMSLAQFHCLVSEDPHKYLKEFHVVWTSMKPTWVTEKQIKLTAFPFSLKDSTKDWLYYLPYGSVYLMEWDEKVVLREIFPSFKGS